jgi:signal transduction histidine kinase
LVINKLIVRKLLALIILLTVFTGSYAQNPADSLRQLIHEADDPRHRIDLLNKLAGELIEINLEESYQTSSQALRDSRKNSYLKGEGWALTYQASYYKFSGQPHRAIELIRQAIQIATQLEDVNLKAYAYLLCGRTYREVGKLDSVRHYFLLAETEQMRQPDYQALWQISASISSMYLTDNNTDKALEYAERSLKLAESLNKTAPLAYSYLDIGNCYRDKFDFVKALSFYQKALDMNGQANWVLTDYNEGIGQLYFLQGDFEKASQAIGFVIKTYEAHNGRNALAHSMIKMAQILQEIGLYDISSEYLYKALKIAETSGYTALAGDAHYELARINYQNNQPDVSLKNVNKAEAIYQSLGYKLKVSGCMAVKGIIYMMKNNFDSSIYYHQTALNVRMALNNKTAISSSFINMGDLYFEFHKSDQALDYFLKGIKYDTELGDFFGVCQFQNKIATIYLQRRDFEKASIYLMDAMKLARQSSSFTWMGITYNNLALLSEAKGNFKESLTLRKQFEAMNDSIYSIGTAQSLASYNTLFELSKKDEQIDLLNKEKLLQQEQIRLRNTILYVVVALVVMLALSVYMFYHYSSRLRRLNRNVQERSEEIETQAEELQESNQALVKLNDELIQRKEEIQHQAEELKVSHETIGKINEGLEKMVEQRTTELRSAYQELDTFFYRSSHDFRRPLTTLMGLAEVAKLSVKDKNALELFEKVSTTAVNLDKMLLKLQSISDVGSHQLVFKEVLLKQIIENALEPYRNTLLDKQARVTIDVKLNKPFISYPVLVKIMMENLIENAITFSNPEQPHVLIRAHRTASSVFIEVEDNGEGIKADVKDHVFEMFFRGSERSMGNGLGLYIARKAVEKISGKISFTNNVDRPGTTFKVEIPDQG